MGNGKDICKYLKGVRRDIADSNGIALDIPECTYEGDCEGTCPQCDHEIQYLEQEMSKRKLLGKAAVVTAMTAVLSAGCNSPRIVGRVPAEPSDDNHEQMVAGSCKFKGQVLDSVSGEPLVLAKVVFLEKKDNNNAVAEAYTDENGKFSLNIPLGSYEVEIAATGYDTRRFDLVVASEKRIKKVFALSQDKKEEMLMGIVPIYRDVEVVPESGESTDNHPVDHSPAQ